MHSLYNDDPAVISLAVCRMHTKGAPLVPMGTTVHTPGTRLDDLANPGSLILSIQMRLTDAEERTRDLNCTFFIGLT